MIEKSNGLVKFGSLQKKSTGLVKSDLLQNKKAEWLHILLGILSIPPLQVTKITCKNCRRSMVVPRVLLQGILVEKFPAC